MAPCTRCSSIPSAPTESGVLYLSPPLAHTLGSLRGLLNRLGIAFSEPSPNLLAVATAPGLFARLAEGIDGVLTRAEMDDTRTLVIEAGASPTLGDLGAMISLGTLVSRVRGEWLSRLVAGERLVSHFQPIVLADAPDRVFAYECLLRGRGPGGELIAPDRIYEAARAADALFPLDRAARLTSIRSAAAQGLDDAGVALFINFNPTSIYNPASCLRSTAAAIAATRFRPEQIVFEVVESDRIEDVDHLLRIMDYYRASGFRVALDDLGSGFGSLSLLGRLRPDFVKLDMELTRGVDRDAYKSGIVLKLLEMSRELGISTIAEGIETEGEAAWMRDHGADYLQGYYIARPAAVPAVPGHLGGHLASTSVR